MITVVIVLVAVVAYLSAVVDVGAAWSNVSLGIILGLGATFTTRAVRRITA